MNTLETLSHDCFDAEQSRPFGGPVTRAASPIFLSGNHDERHAFALISHRCVVDADPIAAGIMNRNATLDAGDHQVSDSYIGKSSPHHHFVITTPRSVAVEVFDRDAFFLKI